MTRMFAVLCVMMMFMVGCGGDGRDTPPVDDPVWTATHVPPLPTPPEECKEVKRHIGQMMPGYFIVTDGTWTFFIWAEDWFELLESNNSDMGTLPPPGITAEELAEIAAPDILFDENGMLIPCVFWGWADELEHVPGKPPVNPGHDDHEDKPDNPGHDIDND